MTKIAAALLVTAALALAGCGGSTAVRTVTIRAAAPPPVVKTVVKWRTPKTIVKHERVVATETSPTSAAPSDCNDLPAAASTTLTQLRESRCEMEKLNAENPSASNEREIESMISSERAIEASE
jgi:hypothetical protein